MSKNYKFLSLAVIISTFMLAACGADPKLDGSSDAAFESSIINMFSEIEFDEKGDLSDENLENLPPALEVYMCYSIKELFSNFSRSEEETQAVIRNTLNGMSRTDLISFGKDNDLIGCYDAMRKEAS